MSIETRENRDRTAEITNAAHGRLVSARKESQSYNREPTFLVAIARELANLRGGTVQHHAGAARRILEAAFCSLEHNEGAIRQSRAVHAA